MMSARTLAPLAALLLTAACSDDAAQPADPWALGDPRADMAVAPDLAPDLAQPDLAPDLPPAPDMEPVLCAECVFDVTTGRLPAENVAQEPGVGPHVSGERLVWKSEVRGPNGEARGEAINTQVPGEAPRRLVYEPNTSYYLMDVQGRNLMYWAVRGEQGRLIARFGEREVVMAEGTLPILTEQGGFDGSANNMISETRAAAVVVQSQPPRQTLVFVSADGRRGEFELPPGGFTPPFVRGQDIVLGAGVMGDPNAQTILWVREPGQQPRKVGARPSASQSSPVIVGQDVLWVREGAVVRGDLMATREEVILDGPCGPLDADAIHAVVACGPDLVSGSGNPPAGAVELYMIDPGQAPQRIYTSAGGRHIVAPRVSADRVAWLEYPPAQTFCSTPTEAPGEVMALAWDVAAARVKVGPQALGPKVAAPCFCCGAYWPPFTLSLAADLIAWRYDMAPDSTERGELGLGWAKLGAQSCRDVVCGE